MNSLKVWCEIWALAISMFPANAIDLPADDIEDCRVRFEDNNLCACSTHDPHGPVKCGEDNHSIEIQPCYCIYFEQGLNTTIVGHCPLSCYEPSHTVIKVTTSTDFNFKICNKFYFGISHRVGRFCGECNDSYGLAAYSYQYISCIECSEDYGYKEWLRYFAVALLPLTIFYIIAVLISFNATSSNYNGLIMIAQCMSSYALLISGNHSLKKPGFIDYYNAVIGCLTSFTNLDFFRGLYSPFCLHPKATVFEVMSLDYIIALYPFLLIFVTYALVTVYDKHYRLLVWIWKPFKICSQRYHFYANLQTSLVEIFATFILLSSVKIIWVSFKILAYTPTYNVAGKQLDYYLTLYDANNEYFGRQHLPYALLSIVMSFTFVFLPLFLLAIYPCGCFQRCLNRCGLSCPTLHMFMDAFQGSFRTDPHDMRSFSALYLLIRVLILAQILMFQLPLPFFTAGLIAFASASVIALFEPHKVASHSRKDLILLLLAGIYFTSVYRYLLTAYLKLIFDFMFGIAIQNVCVFIMDIYFVCFFAWKMLLLRVIIVSVIRKIKDSVNAYLGLQL